MESAQYIASPIDAGKLMLRMVLRNGVVQAGLFLIFAGVHYAIEMVVPTDSLARSLLLQGTGFAWGVGVLAACAWSAATSHNCFVVNRQQSEYAARGTPITERWLLVGGGMAALGMCAMAALAQIWRLPQDVGVAPVVAFWMFLAVVLPAECGATSLSRRNAMICSVLTTWAFVVAFPIYTRDRIGGSLKAAVVAGASMVAMMIGMVVFFLATE